MELNWKYDLTKQEIVNEWAPRLKVKIFPSFLLNHDDDDDDDDSELNWPQEPDCRTASVLLLQWKAVIDQLWRFEGERSKEFIGIKGDEWNESNAMDVNGILMEFQLTEEDEKLRRFCLFIAYMWRHLYLFVP